VLLYRTSRILNFAHGDLATFGTFVAFALLTAGRWPFAAASLASLLATAVVGAAFFFFVIRPAKESTLLGKIVITLGLALVAFGAARSTRGMGRPATN